MNTHLCQMGRSGSLYIALKIKHYLLAYDERKHSSWSSHMLTWFAFVPINCWVPGR